MQKITRAEALKIARGILEDAEKQRREIRWELWIKDIEDHYDLYCSMVLDEFEEGAGI